MEMEAKELIHGDTVVSSLKYSIFKSVMWKNWLPDKLAPKYDVYFDSFSKYIF